MEASLQIIILTVIDIVNFKFTFAHERCIQHKKLNMPASRVGVTAEPGNIQREDNAEPTVNDNNFTEEDMRSMMIWDMEKILNPTWFWQRLNKND